MADATWTAEADALLLAEWEKGTTARAIAKKLYEAGFPHTRNAVIGRINRMRKPGKANPTKRRDPAWPPKKLARSPYGVPTKIPRNGLPPHGCRFIFGDPLGFVTRWCDAPPCEPGGSWCAKHRTIVFQKPGTGTFVNVNPLGSPQNCRRGKTA